jgi:GntR family transcriptional regulator / MocR family aminotransferase
MDPGFLLDISLSVDRSRPGLREQLQEQLRAAIRRGRLAAGDVLPASRVLAADLGVARSVIVEVYQQLIADGYLTARQGSGTRVLPVGQSGSSHDATMRVPPRREVRFFGGLPDPALFPRTVWLRHYRRALTEMPNNQLAYPGPHGTPQLRQAVAGYLRRVRGVDAAPEHAIVCAGVTQAIVLVCRALRARAVQAIAVEDPGFWLHRRAIANTGIRVVPIPVDGDGIQVSQLSSSGVNAVLTAPAHSYPTGAALSADRRAALVAWAREHDGLIIEDDYDAEFRYDRAPVAALQGLAPDRVVYTGCASKTLTPALRLGWMILPPRLVDDVADQKLIDDAGSTVIEQLAMASFIDDGALSRHLRQVRPIYRRRREATLHAVARWLPEASPHGIAAGLHAYIQLPDGCDEAGLIHAAGRLDVIVERASWHWSKPAEAAPALVLGYGALSESSIEKGIETLGSLYPGFLREARASRMRSSSPAASALSLRG